MSRLGDLWLCGNRRNQHRMLCGDATSPEAVARLLGDRKPFLMIQTRRTELSWTPNGGTAPA